MNVPTLLVGASLELLVASLYLAVGALVASRAAREHRPALGWFALYWGGVGAYGLVNAAWSLAMAWGEPALAWGVTVLHLKVLTGAAGFCGLVAYVLSVYTGRRVGAPVVAFYLLVYGYAEWFYHRRQPIGQHEGVWGASLDYANPAGAGWTVLVLLLFVPPLVASLAYALLWRHAHGRRQRLRVALVAASLATFFASLLLGWLSGAWPWWGFAEKVLALLSMLGVVWALAPWTRDPSEAPTATKAHRTS